MRVPVSWLREHVDIGVSTGELAERLSHAGAAVDRVERFADGVSGIVVGRVLEVADVPESDKLCVARIDVGSATVQVVAGAKNFAKDDLVPVALPGARVTTLDVPVGTRKMVGGKYESQGMLCSARELGVADEHAGILVLGDGTAVGADVASLLGLGDDVLEFEIYPNRPDQMSIVGIAREVSVVLGVPLRMPDAGVLEEGPRVAELASVSIEDAAGCPRYLARVIEDVTFAPSPPAVQARLTACGFRPLGNLVDATNYVLLLTGQPLHAFDLDALEDRRIVVRNARAAESLTTIDGEIRELDTTDLVIADAKDAQALAGVMGGETSEVGPGTRRVLLESAYFDPIRIARTSRRQHMRTEASARFERGTDPRAPGPAAAIAADLMRRWAGGRVASGCIDAGGAPQPHRTFLRPERIEAILGIAVGREEVERVLRGLGCEVAGSGERLEVAAPSWRPDLEREIDLIEEIGRLHGYENIPARHRTGERGGRSPRQVLRERVRDALVGAGLCEATLSSFVGREDLEAIGYDGGLVRVSNPMTEEQERLRPNLFAGLLRAAQRNVARGVADVRLFEIGSVFRGWKDGSADLPDEQEHAGFVLTGSAWSDHWSLPARDADVYDAKGIIEVVFAQVGAELAVEPAAGMPFHPGRAANILAGGSVVGRFGELRPSVARAFDLDRGAVIAGFALAPVIDLAPQTLAVRELPSRPPVLRDIAMAVADEVAVADISSTIRRAAGELLESVVLVDVYSGEQVGPGRRSLAFRLTFRAPDRTLTAEEADAARSAIAQACTREHGAQIR